jgi:hypothetical protein
MPKAATNCANPTKSRSPAGVLVRSPVALRLYPDELARLKTYAATEMRTDSAFARLLILYALKAYESGRKIIV